jgi:hypothetical protein
MSRVSLDQTELAEHLTDPRENHRRRPDRIPATYWGMRRMHNELHQYSYKPGANASPDYIAAHVRMWS